MLANDILNPYSEQIEMLMKINKLDEKKKFQVATVVDTLYMVQISEEKNIDEEK